MERGNDAPLGGPVGLSLQVILRLQTQAMYLLPFVKHVAFSGLVFSLTN